MYGSINFPKKTRREREDQGTIVFGMEVRAVSRLICGNFTLWNYYIWILWFKNGEGVLFIVLDPLFQIRACQHKTYNWVWKTMKLYLHMLNRSITRNILHIYYHKNSDKAGQWIFYRTISINQSRKIAHCYSNQNIN